MNKQNNMNKRPVDHGQLSGNTKRKTKMIWVTVSIVLLTALVVIVTATFAQSSDTTLASGDSLEVFCEGRGILIERKSRTHLILTCSGRNHPDPTAEPTEPPTATPPPPTPTPPPTEPTPTTPPGGHTEPYPGAPACEDIGLDHDPRAWHGIWDYAHGCHWDHEHKRNPHDMDDVFGTKIYEWAGGEISYPWQTYAGANDSFEAFVPGTCTENECKHEGYAWLYFRNRTSNENIQGALQLGSHVVTDARAQYHQIGGQMGALTRVHSVWIEARSCYDGIVTNDNAVNETCGIYRGGGWLDLGQLNYPERGIYHPLPSDPPVFSDPNVMGPAEAEPYRIHARGIGSLDSWQSEGNQYNYLPSDPTGEYRLRVGYGIHFPDSPGDTNPENFGNAGANQQFWCHDEATDLYTCEYNNSSAALFRLWVTIPAHLDGSQYDEDGQVNGYFTFHGYTNRYGDIVTGCSQPGLDCVPAEAEHFPVGGCNNHEGHCKSAYRGSTEQDLFEADLAPLIDERTDEHDWWIKYPN